MVESEYEVSKANYDAARTLLNRADLGHGQLTDAQRKSLNSLIRRYQTERLQL